MSLSLRSTVPACRRAPSWRRRLASAVAALGAASAASVTIAASDATAASANAAAPTAYAAFAQPDPDFKGRQFTIMRLPVTAGGTAPIGGNGFPPGQPILVHQAGVALEAVEPIVVDAQGRFYGRIRVPEHAVPGIHQVVVSTVQPATSTVFTIQVSPQVPLSGGQEYEISRRHLPIGPYQVVYSKRLDRLFVTATEGGGRTAQLPSALYRIDPATLRIDAEVGAPPVPGTSDGSIMGVFGLALDEANDTLWVGHVRHGTLGVYRLSDMQYRMHFPLQSLKHPRDILIDARHDRAYVSDMGTASVAVFDSKQLLALPAIAIASKTDQPFVPTGMALDAARNRLYVASLRTQEIAVIDLQAQRVAQVFSIPGTRGLVGLSFDPQSRLLYMAAQQSDTVTIFDVDKERVRAQTQTGANPLSVVYNPADGLAYVANRASATVTVVDRDGRIQANLAGSSYNNHMTLDGQNNVIVLNKKTEANEPDGDQISRIRRM